MVQYADRKGRTIIQGASRNAKAPVLMTAIASPYQIEALPRQALFYKGAFRSGTANSTRAGRLLNRLAFYALETLRNEPCYGRFKFYIGDSIKSIRVDARNRQYSALYFDAFVPVYEPDVTAAMVEFAPRDGVLFDVGSNWGYFSLLLAAQPDFTGRIHAFEPWPGSYADLTSMVAQAGLGEVITTHKLALGERPGRVAMQCGRHSGLAQIVEAGADQRLEQVQQVTLDSLDLPDPDFIKLDVEGAEGAILRGARQVLARARPVIIFEHTPGVALGRDRDVRSELAEHGYHLYQPLPTLSPDAPRVLRLVALTAAQVDALTQRGNLLAFPGERRASLSGYLSGG